MRELMSPWHLIILLFALPMVFLPTLIAGSRKAEHYWWIALTNLLAGGTGIGWLIALVWALKDQPAREAISS